MFLNVLSISASNVLKLNCFIGQTKKYVCFRLPTVPKFRSPTLIFFMVVFGFLTIDSSRKKCFQFRVYFCCNLY